MRESDEMQFKRGRVCVDCELEWRQKNTHLHADDPEWATTTSVRKDQKRAAKGQLWTVKGQHYKKACEIVEKCLDPDNKPTQRELKRMKTAKCKELAEALVEVIKGGRMFSAFMRANERQQLSSTNVEACEKAYEEYLQDPENKEKLEELEELVAEDHEYKTAGGDTEILKALDYHNDMSEGFNMFDLCRAKVGTHARI